MVKGVERAYGTWLRAQNRGGKQGVGSRWLRNMDGGGRWSEAGGGSGSQGNGGDSAKEVARFKEVKGVVRENPGDNFGVVIEPKNQGLLDKEGNNLNLSENNQTVIALVDSKRKRIELDHIQLESGPVVMQTDGPQYEESSKSIEVTDPKNLYGAGPGVQARRGL